MSLLVNTEELSEWLKGLRGLSHQDQLPLQISDSIAEEDAVKTMVDGWHEQKQALVYKYLYLLGMRIGKAESLLRKRRG